MIGRNSFNRISSLIRKWEGALWLAGAVGVVLIGGILSWWFWDKLGGDTESFSTTLRNVALVIGGVEAILLAVWRKGLSIRGIARELSIHRDTVRKYIDAESPPMSPARATSAVP